MIKKIATLLLLLTFAIPGLAQESQNDSVTTVYYFIRHAEKDRTNSANKNPDLTAMGQLRANNWAKVFSNVALDAVYSTPYNRTQQTAAPVARRSVQTPQAA